jgi:molybdate transport system permease protein
LPGSVSDGNEEQTGTVTSFWTLSPAEWDAVALSLRVSLAAVAVSLPFGLTLGWLLARRQFPGKSVVETLVNLPLVMPPVVVGYLLLVACGRHGFIGRPLEQWFGLRLVFTWEGAALAAAVMAFPLMVRSIRLAITAVDARLEHAARTLGATRWDVFFTVTVPLARHGIIAGTVLAFARSMGEFGATILIAGNIPGETRTVSLYIFNVLESPDGLPQALRLVVVAILIAAAALAAGEYLERQGRRKLESAER